MEEVPGIMSEDKKLGLGSVVSISVGLVIATSCLVSLGQGAPEMASLRREKTK